MTIIWKEFLTWEPLVSEILTPEKAAELTKKMKQTDTTEYFDDDPDWLTLLKDNLDASFENIESALAGKLQSQTVRVYHGCRPINLTSYTSLGLLVHNHEKLTEELRILVKSDPRLKSIDIDKRVAEVVREHDKGRSFVTFDDLFMLEYAGHYLIYGGEWIAAILGHNNRGVLLERGTPTFLLIDLPGSMIPFTVLEGLAKDMLTEWAKQVTKGPRSIRKMDSGVELEFDLDPKYIIGHEHPKEIKDPWNSRNMYKVKNLCCSEEKLNEDS